MRLDNLYFADTVDIIEAREEIDRMLADAIVSSIQGRQNAGRSNRDEAGHNR
jgi:hypothetical protein